MVTVFFSEKAWEEDVPPGVLVVKDVNLLPELGGGGEGLELVAYSGSKFLEAFEYARKFRALYPGARITIRSCRCCAGALKKMEAERSGYRFQIGGGGSIDDINPSHPLMALNLAP